jgi:hypothetical protein
MGTFLRRRNRRWSLLLAFQFVDVLDEKKNRKGNDDEVYDGVDEEPKID